MWTCLSLEGAFVGGKNLSSQLQNATLKFSGKFQINVIKLIKLDDDMCHPNWHIKICHVSFGPQDKDKFLIQNLWIIIDDVENTTSKSHGPCALLIAPAQQQERT